MTTHAVLLFGSQARGDAQPGSDVDILLVTSEPKTRHVTMGTISYYLYPWRQLLVAAESGDLFACHISCEAKAIHDPDHRLDQLRNAFHFKSSYADEISRASDLGWFLVHHSATLPNAVVAKRSAWCVRTALIARAAEQRRAIFAASELAAFSGWPGTRALIANKDEPSAVRRSVRLLRSFLYRFGIADPIPGGDADAYRQVFRKTRNRVAEQTLRSGAQDDLYTAAKRTHSRTARRPNCLEIAQ